MSFTTSINFSGLRPLGQAEISSTVSATAIFAGVPDNASGASFTIRGATLTMTFNGTTTPTAGAIGVDYAPGTYTMANTTSTFMRQVQAIGGGTLSIAYWGVQ